MTAFAWIKAGLATAAYVTTCVVLGVYIKWRASVYPDPGELDDLEEYRRRRVQ